MGDSEHVQVGWRSLFLGSGSRLKFQLESVPLPSSRRLTHDGSILAKLRLSTICGSDLHTIQGRREAHLPLVLGHEGVGQVVAISDNHISGLKVGDRFVFSIITSCGRCVMCAEKELPQKCAEMVKIGHCSLEHSCGWNGTFASHILIPPNSEVVRISDEVSDRAAAPAGCALATACNALWPYLRPLGKAQVPETAWIQGGGALGVYCCAILSHLGCSRIYCSDMSSVRLSVATMFGATTICLRDCGSQVPMESSVDLVVEACGQKAVVDSGLKALRPGGVYKLLGLVHDDTLAVLDLGTIVKKCLRVEGFHNYNGKQLQTAVRFLEETVTVFPYERLVGPIYRLNKMEEAVEEAERADFIRVGVTCG